MALNVLSWRIKYFTFILRRTFVFHTLSSSKRKSVLPENCHNLIRGCPHLYLYTHFLIPYQVGFWRTGEASLPGFSCPSLHSSAIWTVLKLGLSGLAAKYEERSIDDRKKTCFSYRNFKILNFRIFLFENPPISWDSLNHMV